MNGIYTRRSFLMQSLTAATLASTLASARQTRTRSVLAKGAPGKSLTAGVAVRDITPPTGQQMWGYSNPEQISEGVRDPLYCRTLVLGAGDSALGIVVLDLGRMHTPDVVQRIRERVASRGIDDVIVCATHTHSGPYMELPDLSHLKPVEDAIVDSLGEAANKLEPVTVRLARTNIDISHNRRFIQDGVCYMRWRNESRKPTSPIDHEAGVIVMEGRDGRPVATLVNFACHPVIFASDNRRYSADWPGEMCWLVKEATGAECFFLQAAAGDINPYLDKTPVAEGAEEAVKSEGARAAHAVLDAIGRTEPVAASAPSFHYREEPVEVGTRWDLTDPGQVAILENYYGYMYQKYMEGVPPDLAVPLGILLINDDLALSFMPGELFVDFQLDLKKRSPVRNTFLCGYANEFHVYFPTVRDITYGGYGAATVTYVGAGAGEKLVTQSTVMIGEMTGGIHELRGPEDFEIKELL